MDRILFLLAFLPVAAKALIGRTQSAGVEGILMCGTTPAKDVVVKLYDDDRGVDTDDLMAEGKTDSRGYFKLVGSEDELTTIDPKLNIYHDCNDGDTPCQRKLTFWIPDTYVYSGKTPSKIYNVGTINIANQYAGEERDCMH